MKREGDGSCGVGDGTRRSSLPESGGQGGQGRDKCVKRERDGSCGVGDGTRRSSLP